jgi:NAD(P)-dependent dehydrogenase (short-subunit alcohol dehydrogenase family)
MNLFGDPAGFHGPIDLGRNNMEYLEKLFSLKGKTALVTGGGRGIGQVVALGLARAGAEIVILSRGGADETVKLIEGEGGRAYSLIADVTKEEEVDAALAGIVSRSGGSNHVLAITSEPGRMT